MEQQAEKQKISIYTDGACSGNPGPGGYGIILEAPGYPSKELSKGYRLTTNNRMELLAVIVALQALKKDGLDITIYSDSQYVVESISKGWVFGWHKKGFAKKKNPDLWRQYILLHQKHKPKLEWIKGHDNHPQNERCDKLAVAASKSPNLAIDEYFEAQKQGGELFS